MASLKLLDESKWERNHDAKLRYRNRQTRQQAPRRAMSHVAKQGKVDPIVNPRPPLKDSDDRSTTEEWLDSDEDINEKLG